MIKDKNNNPLLIKTILHLLIHVFIFIYKIKKKGSISLKKEKKKVVYKKGKNISLKIYKFYIHYPFYLITTNQFTNMLFFLFLNLLYMIIYSGVLLLSG